MRLNLKQSLLNLRRRDLMLTALSLIMYDRASAQNQVVRGQVLFQSGAPAPGVAVRVWNPQMGPSGVSFSGQDGMYYLHGIPPGGYQLQLSVNGQLLPIWQIQVFLQPMTDIAPYRLPW
jgi:hypothetical protein